MDFDSDHGDKFKTVGFLPRLPYQLGKLSDERVLLIPHALPSLSLLELFRVEDLIEDILTIKSPSDLRGCN